MSDEIENWENSDLSILNSSDKEKAIEEFKTIVKVFKRAIDGWRDYYHNNNKSLGIKDTASRESQVRFIVKSFGWIIRKDE